MGNLVGSPIQLSVLKGFFSPMMVCINKHKPFFSTAISSDNNDLCALILFACLISKKQLSGHIHGIFFVYLKIFLSPGGSSSVLAPANAFDSKGLRAMTGALVCARCILH